MKSQNIINIQKPNWTPLELNDNYLRLEDLRLQLKSHDFDCSCDLCMEKFSLDILMDCFSEDEHAGAVIADNQRIEKLLDEMEAQMDAADVDFNFENDFKKDYFRYKSAREIIKAVKISGNLEEEIKFWIEETLENTEHFIALSPLRPNKFTK